MSRHPQEPRLPLLAATLLRRMGPHQAEQLRRHVAAVLRGLLSEEHGTFALLDPGHLPAPSAAMLDTQQVLLGVLCS